MPSLSSLLNVPTAPFDLFVCTGALSLQDISNALLWFFLQILTIISRPFFTSSHLMWCWKIHIKDHVSLMPVQRRRLWQQNHHCSSVSSKFIPFLHTSSYLLISHCHWCCHFFYRRPCFSGKRVHLTDKKHGSSHALQDLTMHTGHESPPVRSLSSAHPLFFHGVLAGRRNSSIKSAFTSPETTQRAAGQISHEEYKRLWKLYGELHLTYTYAELRNYCFLDQFLKANTRAHTS